MSLCGCVCLCMPVCRQWGTDAERCVLIFFIALGSSGGRRRAALMSRMCHCRTFSSEATARGDQNGMFILPTSPPSPHLCATLFLSLILLRCYIRWKVFYCHHAPPPPYLLTSLESREILHDGEKAAVLLGGIKCRFHT